MTRLEDELRGTFAAHVAEVPSIRDVAGSAIARGRVVRRRQRLTAGAAFAVVIALVAAGTWWARTGRVDGQPGRQVDGVAAASLAPTRVTPGESPLFDLVVGGELRPAGHAPIALPGTGDVYDAVRVSEGWLVVRGDKSTHQLWLVRVDGAPTLLVSALPTNFASSADGRRIAFQQGSTLTVATLAGGKATAERVVQLPGHDGNQGRTGTELVGWAGGYVVIGNRLGIDYDAFDVWDPARGTYVPTWNSQVVRVYAATPDGRSVVGAVKGAQPGSFCAAVLEPTNGLQPGTKMCGQQVLIPFRHGLSPDGRRLLGQAGGGVGIVDTTTGALTGTVAASAVSGSGWPAVPVWVDSTTFVVPNGSDILYVDVADPTHPRQLAAPSTSERWLVVPRVGE